VLNACAAGVEAEDVLATRLVNLLDWNVPYTLCPVTGTAVTAQFVLPPTPPPIQGQTPDQALRCPTPGAMREHKPLTTPVTSPAAMAPLQDTHGPKLLLDPHGVPRAPSGHRVAEWLTVGSLVTVAHSVAAVSHRATAAWLKRWHCVRCGGTLLASFDGVAAHAARCGLSEAERGAGYTGSGQDGGLGSSQAGPAQARCTDGGSDRAAEGAEAACVHFPPPEVSTAVGAPKDRDVTTGVAAGEGTRDGPAVDVAGEGGGRCMPAAAWVPAEPRRCKWGRRVCLVASETGTFDDQEMPEGKSWLGGGDVGSTSASSSVRANLLRNLAVVTQDDAFLKS
jgi:hypothetical protein